MRPTTDPKDHHLDARALAWTSALLVLGWVSTSSIGHPLWLLPMLRVLVKATSRGRAALGAAAMHLGGYHDVLLSPAGFFPELGALQASVLGMLAWAGVAAVATLPYVLTWCGRRRPGLWLLLACVLTTVPPLGWLTPVNPLHVAGWLFPGLGFIGVVLTLGALTVLPSIRRPAAGFQTSRAGLLALPLVGTVCWSNLVFQAPSPPSGWIAHDLALGAYVDSAEQAWKRSETIATLVQTISGITAPAAQARASLILPEYAAGAWREGTAHLMQSAFSARGLLRPRVLVMFGAELPHQDGPINALMVLHPSGHLSYLRSRITLPVVNWRPGTGGFQARPWAVPSLQVNQVGLVTVGFCWEDLLPWMHYQAMWHRPAVHVSVASLWWAKGTQIERNLRLYVAGVQRIFRVPVLLSVNVAETS